MILFTYAMYRVIPGGKIRSCQSPYGRYGVSCVAGLLLDTGVLDTEYLVLEYT